jgi:hypothetical protein
MARMNETIGPYHLISGSTFFKLLLLASLPPASHSLVPTLVE